MSTTAARRLPRLRSAIGVLAVSGVYAGAALVPIGRGSSTDPALTIASGVVLAIAVVGIAARLALDARSQFAVWFCLLFLNLAAVAIEGTLFAPAAAPPTWLGVNLIRLALGSALVAGLVAALFHSDGNIDQSIRARPIHGWLSRLIAAAIVYLFLYLVLGGINYTLVTHPYYESHAGGLTVPSAETVLLYEPLRGLLLALSVLPLVLALPHRTAVVSIAAGFMLFLVGGVVPLLPQQSLPFYLRIASMWEIFGQNFLTGVGCAYLFLGRQVMTPARAESCAAMSSHRASTGRWKRLITR